MRLPSNTLARIENMVIETSFLQSIIPHHEIVCLATQRSFPANGHGKQPWTHHFVDPSDPDFDMSELLNDWNKHADTNIYFAVAGYKQAGDRKKNNVACLQTLLLDVDLWTSVKDKKSKKKADYYLSKKEVLSGLKNLRGAVPGLPKPWVVDSGHGIHIYFALDTAMPVGTWKPLAEHFVRVVRKVEPKMLADPVRTRDVTSVMRVPGSFNAKTKKTTPTKLLVTGDAGTLTDIRSALGAAVDPSTPVASVPDPSGLGPVPAYAQADGRNQFGGIPLLDLPLRPVLAGCKQMRSIAYLRGAVPEPLWVLALRVFATVKNPNKAALYFSNGHPTFSAQQTLYKMDHVRENFDAPSAGCAEFAACGEADNCKGCEFANRVWSPSQIPLIDIVAKQVEREEAKVREQLRDIPATPDAELPLPAFYKRLTTVSGEEITMLPVPNKNDPSDERGLIRAHIFVRRGSILLQDQLDSHGKIVTRPRDLRVHLQVKAQGRSFPLVVPAVDLSSDRLETATKALRDVGVLVQADTPPEQRAVQKYLRYVLDVTALGNPLPYRPDKGWSAAYPMGTQPLTLGALRWTPNGSIEEGCTKGQHLGSDSESFIEAFCSGRPVGSLADWQQGMEVYNHPKMELTHMLLLSGVANMLLPVVSNQKGGLLLALSGRSGVGKTTLLRFMGSFIGDPGRCMIPGSSTPNALVNMLKQAQFFMLPVDDTLQLDAQQLTLLLSSVSSGMERMRLHGGGGEAYTANWADPFYSSLLITSNYSMESLIGTGGQGAQQLQSDAARSRLLEIPADVIRLNKLGADEWLHAENLIANSYGHAVAALAQYLTVHQKQVAQLVNKMRVQIERQLAGQTPIDQQALARFWARYIACVGVTATILCDRLGLLPWDPKAIIATAVSFVQGHHVAAAEDREKVVENLWDTLTDNEQGRLRINYSYLKTMTKPAGTPAMNDWPAWDDESVSASQRRRRFTDWDTDASGAMLLSNLNIGAPPSVANVMNQPHCWRVILTTVSDQAEKLQSIERTVEISLAALENLTERTYSLPVTGWEELYYSLMMAGCTVKGVNPQRPSRWGRGVEQVHAQLDKTNSSKGVTRAAVRIVFPPLPPDVLEAG